MRTWKALFVFIASIVIIPFAAQNYIAEEVCDHQWERYLLYYEEVDITQHKKIERFRCSNCSEVKTTETLEDHQWNPYDTSHTYVDETQHNKMEMFYCPNCHELKRSDTLEDHQWELYDTSYEYIDETQHKKIETFRCSKCYGFKTTEALEDHPWEFSNYKYESVDAKQHKRTEIFYCSDCRKYKSTETLEDHAWEHEDSWNYNDLSETQHSYSESFSCSTCGGYKTETAKSAHKWVLSSKYHSDVKSISSGQHSYTSCYYCDNCHRYKYPSSKEKHKFDKYGICQICKYYKTGTITLKSNSTVSVNEDMWMKVTAPQKGLLYLYVRNTKYPWIELYNSKKWKFPIPDGYTTFGGKGKVIIPVSKGTYYLKLSYPMYDTIKYVFKADPSKKNYTQNKAISAKQNKTYTTVIYSGDKKNTWNRYYKLKLTKKQRITLLPTYGNVGSLFNSKGEYISTSSYYDKNGNWAGYTTERKLPKGTYYLKIYASWNSVTRKQTTGRYYSFKWK